MTALEHAKIKRDINQESMTSILSNLDNFHSLINCGTRYNRKYKDLRQDHQHKLKQF